jgi:hypothetical protein
VARLFFTLCRAIPQDVDLAGTLIFGVHPAGPQAITWIAARADKLVTLCALLSARPLMYRGEAVAHVAWSGRVRPGRHNKRGVRGGRSGGRCLRLSRSVFVRDLTFRRASRRAAQGLARPLFRSALWSARRGAPLRLA